MHKYSVKWHSKFRTKNMQSSLSIR